MDDDPPFPLRTRIKTVILNSTASPSLIPIRLFLSEQGLRLVEFTLYFAQTSSKIRLFLSEQGLRRLTRKGTIFLTKRSAFFSQNKD